MRYQLAPIYCRPWVLNGLSKQLIESHYENNYGGALRKLNAITEKLESLDYASTAPYIVNSLKREELIALNSTLLHELYFAMPGRRWETHRDPQAGAGPGFWFGRPLAQRVRCHGERTGRRFGVGVARLRAARRSANQPVRIRSQPGNRGRHSDSRAGHVRARLPHRLWRQRKGVHRGFHAQRRLESGAGSLRGCLQGRAATPTRARGVRGCTGRFSGRGQGDDRCRQTRPDHRCAAAVLRFPHAGHHGRRSVA